MALPVHVAFTFTDSHWALAYAAARSVCVTSRAPAAVTLHFLHEGLSTHHRTELDLLAAEYGCPVLHYDITGHPDVRALAQILRATRRNPPIVYSRLLLDRILPPGIERVLYLDSDVMVLEDLSPLFDLDLDGNALGAVTDLFQLHHRQGRDLREDRGMAGPGQRYFNGGVLLFDLKKLAGANIPGLAASLSSKVDHSRFFFDQDLGNIAFLGRWKRLDWRYNVMEPERAHRTLYPAIVHFTGKDKPWYLLPRNAFARPYRHMMTNRIFYGQVRDRWRKKWYLAPLSRLLPSE